MVVASWADKASVLASAGVRECRNCGNTSEHVLIEIRKRVSLMFIRVASLDKGKHAVCPVCQEMTAVSDTEAADLVRASLS